MANGDKLTDRERGIVEQIRTARELDEEAAKTEKGLQGGETVNAEKELLDIIDRLAPKPP